MIAKEPLKKPPAYFWGVTQRIPNANIMVKAHLGNIAKLQQLYNFSTVIFTSTRSIRHYTM